MPRENRKRGRGNRPKKQEEEEIFEDEPAGYEPPPQQDVLDQAIAETRNAEASTSADGAAEPPPYFPEIDADAKAYWRAIDDKIRELEGLGVGNRRAGGADNQEGEDEDDERHLLIRSALAELSGQELALAADPDTSVILERLLHSMDDFAKRVLADRFTGEYRALSAHRHASHVLQTLLTLSVTTLEREALGNVAPVPGSDDAGELLSLSDLIANACEELLPDVPTLATEPSATHILCLLLLITSGKSIPEDQHRSRKSAKWRARQGPMRSLVSAEPTEPVAARKGKGKSSGVKVTEEVRRAGEGVYRALKKAWGTLEGAQARQAASDPVASQAVQIVLQMEAERGESEVPGSLTDHVLAGLVSGHDSGATPVRSDYVETCLRDVTPSHVLEVIILSATPTLFSLIYETYFSTRLNKLAGHPVANFVVAKAFSRLDAQQLLGATQETSGKMGDMIDSARTGPLQSLVARAAACGSGGGEVVAAILKAFGLEEEANQRYAVPCFISLMRLDYFRKTTAFTAASPSAPDISTEPLRLPESNMQGALLLQSLLRLPVPHAQPFIKSFQSLPLSFTLAFSRDPIASHCLDAILESTTIPPRDRRQFLLRFIGHYHTLADDRVGSRVADRCWATADGYLKEKIAESVVGEQRKFQESAYGHHFARRLYLPLFERRRDDWKAKVTEESRAAQPPPSTLASVPAKHSDSNPRPSHHTTEARKKEKRPVDAVDAIFNSVSKKSKSSFQKSGKGNKGRQVDGRGGHKTGDAAADAAADVLGSREMADVRRMLGRL